MDYRLEDDETLSEGIKRVGLSLNQQAIDQIKKLSKNKPHEAIHESRKRFKEIRALMRLVRDNIGEEVYQRQNTFYRDLGREISDLRDSKALRETLNDITEEYKSKIYKNAFANTEDFLKKRLENLVKQDDPLKKLQSIEEKLEHHKKNLERLPVDAENFQDIGKSIKRTYKRGYKLHSKIKKKPSSKNFHQWRKRAKYSRYHMDILRCYWPDIFEALEDSFHDLTDHLGDDHDMVVFMNVLEEEYPDNEDLKILRAFVKDRRARCQEKAASLGDKLYYEKPKIMIKRLSHYGKVQERSYTDMENIPQV